MMIFNASASYFHENSFQYFKDYYLKTKVTLGFKYADFEAN
jgi:hypothetical protein